MTTFYPGPSQIYPQIAHYMQDAFKSGILSANHRSTNGMALVKETVELLHEKMNIPADYSIFFTSSATESWEIINQSFYCDNILHIYNGAFGEKWYEYSKKLAKKDCISKAFGINEEVPYFELEQSNIICLTQNETSNGTQINMELLAKINKTETLLAIDATSSMAGIELNYQLADIWFASVQKCFGLPAGLALMVCSPKAIQIANEINAQKHYNSLLNIAKNMALFQTTHTPNILGIYLLNSVLHQIPNISETSKRIKAQANSWYDFLKTETDFELLCENKKTQSDTVIVVKGKPEKIITLKAKTIENGLILGNGYGNLKDTTFRIANFPAIDPKEIEKLKKIF